MGLILFGLIDGITRCVSLSGESPFPGGFLSGDDPRKGLVALFLVILVPLLVLFFFVIRAIYKHTLGEKFKTTVIQDFRREAEGYERGGRYVSAARLYVDQLKEYDRAAALYEKGGDFRQAAALYDTIGMTAKAKEMYEKDGNFGSAAEMSVREGDFEGAAILYEKAGNKLDAAIILERAGKKLDAVRAYREAGEYRRAAMLLEEEGMAKEAAEMFGLALHGKDVQDSNIDDFYEYALKLEGIGAARKAADLFEAISRVDPAFRDVTVRLRSLTASLDKDADLKGKRTLRSFLRGGRIEPKYGLKLWVQILRALKEAHEGGRPYGLISPEVIAIDSRNNVSFLKRQPSSIYIPPEITKEIDLDVRADIYSMGLILYEMLTGSLDGIGSSRVGELAEDVPEWLDEIVIKCLRKVKEDRYRSISEIFADLSALGRIRRGEKTLAKGKRDHEEV